MENLTAELARVGVSGRTDFRADGTLVVAVTSAAEQPDDQSAQVVWAVLDAALMMPAGCPYQQLEVVLLFDETHLRATVSATDLRAWATGELDEGGIIDRILYIEEALSP
jgi:hypothetical protein